MSRGINLRAVSNFKRPLFICMSDSLDSFSNEEYIGVLLFWKVSWDFQNFNDSYNMRKRGNNKNNDNNNNNKENNNNDDNNLGPSNDGDCKKIGLDLR